VGWSNWSNIGQLLRTEIDLEPGDLAPRFIPNYPIISIFPTLTLYTEAIIKFYSLFLKGFVYVLTEVLFNLIENKSS
jgi:hypothetical protein